ncbi:bifunctional UDP-3-O-[3-hydroxymyristoyl] N-acetylglucosamine deacetylase/3-hydroxyacyl-ACP dehydratase, partial [Candidatus Fermentibacteria bacterium]|nr:bifunctional UDP-3-O-[3-hydroxymyristoyl] N-acetylglucosamine deacetylase/3-hydroxyacyl-ACP dehydratase [Candidatus Fermentibacteria bacterium]
MSQFQTTIANTVTYRGVGLHTGKDTNITFKPAPPNSGITFVRMDDEKRPTIHAICSNVRQVEEQSRRTTLGENYYEVHTVEHVLSALFGLGIDNAMIEIDSDEPPEPEDGSVATYVEVLDRAGVLEQREAPARILKITEAVSIESFGAHLTAVPYDGFRISFTIDYRHPVLGAQFASMDITPEIFRREIAPARTFCFYKDVRLLQEKNLIRGGTLENAIVIGDDGILNREPLRFPDEFVRHKILDLLGDLSLLGHRLQGHFISAKSGHASNVQFVRKIEETCSRRAREQSRPIGASPGWNVADVMRILPHRYPFLLVDRILDMQPEKRIVGIKNVTINEPFFQGHFPGHPIMPAVLIIEAMAQTGGVLLLSSVDAPASKLVYFSGIDQARFRRPVIPGDQLRFELEMLKLKGALCKMRGQA